MISKIANFRAWMNRVSAELKRLQHLEISVHQSKMLNAQAISRINFQQTESILENINLAEFQVFSQWGDDGLIDFLVTYLEIEDQRFVEFGVENYTEANTRYLLMNKNWSGLIMDGSPENITHIKNSLLYVRHDLTAESHFITAENINQLLIDYGFEGKIGLLHIDIDGNDYWVWKAIDVASPVIVILEYNAVFGTDKSWVVPYHPQFFRTEMHYSNLYWGSSLRAQCELAQSKGYSFVGCNNNGNNAYFVQNAHLKNLKVQSVESGFRNSKFRESRDSTGKLSFISGSNRIEEIRGLEVLNIHTNQIEKI
jgi:hypothetical protein